MDVLTRELVAEQHVVDDLSIHLAHAVVAGLSQEVGQTWRELEGRILSLLAVEELLMLPLLGPDHEEAAARTREEHRHIRGLVSELRVAVGLRNIRIAAIEKLRCALREHAEHAAGALYRNAWERTTVAAQHRLAAALRSAARCAHQSEPPPPAAPHLAVHAMLARES